MIGYVTLGTNDLERAAKFYDPLAAELGTLTRQQVLARASQALRSQAAALPRQVLGILLGAGSGTS